MAAGVTNTKGETQEHARLKRLALIWAQAHGFSACAMEVTLPKCRYRADVAACGRQQNHIGTTVIFECKRVLCDLRRDNCQSEAERGRFKSLCRRRQLLETRLHEHYPSLHNGDSLFAEFDPQNFVAIGHRGYARLLRELCALQSRLYDCTKFEKLVRYRCANLFLLVLPIQLFGDSEIPVGWGALVESDGALRLKRKPTWHETTAENRARLLYQIGAAGTRALNRQLEVASDEIAGERSRLINCYSGRHE